MYRFIRNRIFGRVHGILVYIVKNVPSIRMNQGHTSIFSQPVHSVRVWERLREERNTSTSKVIIWSYIIKVCASRGYSVRDRVKLANGLTRKATVEEKR
jgi:hypothetical protein